MFQALTAVPPSCLFFKRQTRYAQTSDVFKNKQLGGTAVEAKSFTVQQFLQAMKLILTAAHKLESYATDSPLLEA